MNRYRPFRSELVCVLLLGLFCTLFSTPLWAKTAVDFNPNVDFSKYKTFVFIGGVENLVMLQLDPDVVNDRLHHDISQELAKKGIHEAQPGQRADLVIRYWANPSQQVNVTTMGNWAPFAPYIGSYWSFLYNDVSAASVKEGSLIIDLIDPRTKDLVWRLYLIRKMVNTDKDWKKTDEELARGFENFPPSDTEKEAKKKERAAHPPNPSQPQ